MAVYYGMLFVLFLSLIAEGFTKDESEQILCVPGRSFYRDCNECHCSKHSFHPHYAACSRKNCPIVRCEPGSKRMYNCNECTCQDNGIEVCDKKPCITKSCKADHIFMLGCRLCQCNKEGTDFACDTSKCEILPTECVPNQKYITKTVDCLCGSSGNALYCSVSEESMEPRSESIQTREESEKEKEIRTVYYSLVDRVVGELMTYDPVLFKMSFKYLFESENLSNHELVKLVRKILQNGADTLKNRSKEYTMYQTNKMNMKAQGVTELQYYIGVLCHAFQNIPLDQVPMLYKHLKLSYIINIGFPDECPMGKMRNKMIEEAIRM